jgi:hypothetical protein
MWLSPQGLIFTAQPYATAWSRENEIDLAAVCAAQKLLYRVSRNGSWYYPGKAILIEVWKPGPSLAMSGSVESRLVPTGITRTENFNQDRQEPSPAGRESQGATTVRAVQIRNKSDVQKLGTRWKLKGRTPYLTNTRAGATCAVRYRLESFSEFMALRLAKALGISVPKIVPFSSWADLRYAGRGGAIGLKPDGRYRQANDVRFGYLIEGDPDGEFRSIRLDWCTKDEFCVGLQLLRLFLDSPRSCGDISRDENDALHLWTPPDMFQSVIPHAPYITSWLESCERWYSSGSSNPQRQVAKVLASWQATEIAEDLVSRLRKLCQTSEEERLNWMQIDGVPNDRLLSIFFTSLVSRRLNVAASHIGERPQDVADWSDALPRSQWGDRTDWRDLLAG